MGVGMHRDDCMGNHNDVCLGFLWCEYCVYSRLILYISSDISLAALAVADVGSHLQS